MTMYAVLEFVFILLLILLNGALAMSELAVVAARKPRLQQLAEDGNKGAATALQLSNDPGSFLSSVQIGITLVGILIGAFGGVAVADLISGWLSTVPVLVRYADAIAIGLVVILLTYITLILGELVPKQIALRDSEAVASKIARPMRLLARLTAPFVSILSYSSALVMRLLRLHTVDEPAVSEADVRSMLEHGAELGVFEPEEEELVGQVFRLADLDIGDLITPRTDIIWLDENDTPEDIRKIVIASGRSRLPVARDTLDQVTGIVLAKDLLAQCLSDQPLDLRSIMQPALFVPETTPALTVVERFKETHSKMVMIIDEYGGLEGLVTVDDVMEALVGDIPEPEETLEPDITQRKDGSWLVDGLLLIEDLEEHLGLPVLPEDSAHYRTCGGLVMAQLGRLPEVGNTFEWEGYTFEVVDMDGNRVDKILVYKQS